MLLQGKHVHLRDWLIDDLDDYARWLAPGNRWQALDAPYYRHTTADEIPDLIAKTRTRISDGNFPDPRMRLIIAEPHSNRMIGQVSRYWISEETHWLAAGIVIYDPAQWGRGYGYDALGLWTDYLFRTLPQIVRLDLQKWSGNQGMMALATKLGYQLEGRFRNARIVQGEYYDSLGYGILRHEWDALHPRGFAG